MDTVLIPLTQDRFAVVDKEYAGLVNRCNWSTEYDKSGNYYAKGRPINGICRMHRYMWEQVVDDIPQGMEIDHIDGDGLNNRISNLRVVTHRENQQNRREHRNGSSTSKYVGVHWSRTINRWRAQICINGKTTNLGNFTVEEDASEAYQKALASLKHQ